MKNRIMTSCSRILMVTMLSLSLWAPGAQAGIVTSDQLIAKEHHNAGRDRLRALLDRQDVREQLQAQGVDPGLARARVDALTDDEVAMVNGKLDKLPAGGDGLIGAIVFIFIVLLVTDILGLTKVFPFTKPIKR